MDKAIPVSKRAAKRLINAKARRQGETHCKMPRREKDEAAADLVNKFNDHLSKETSYYFSDGLRHVKPYYFNFETYAKRRWVGRPLLQCYQTEFKHHPPEYYTKAMEMKRVSVNGKTVDESYVVKENDLLQHRTHRHELPVADKQIEIIADLEDFLVVNKPCSIPVHPCGRYRHNSLSVILAREHGHYNLRSVMMFGKSEEFTRKFMENIKKKMVSKCYLAKVEGQFPREKVICSEPLDALCKTMGLYYVCSEGKESKTTFEFLSSDGENSIVKCHPHTGRTHQIRIHLQFLGHPIVNDFLYNSESFGSSKGKGAEFGKTKEQLIEDLRKEHKKAEEATEEYLNNLRPAAGDHSNAEVATSDPICLECFSEYSNPLPEQLEMFLHAHSYSGPGFSYTAPLPAWAKDAEAALNGGAETNEATTKENSDATPTQTSDAAENGISDATNDSLTETNR